MTDSPEVTHARLLAKAWVVRKYDQPARPRWGIENRRWAMGISARILTGTNSIESSSGFVMARLRRGTFFQPRSLLLLLTPGVTLELVSYVAHVCEVDYRNEHSWVRDPEIAASLGEASVPTVLEEDS